MSERPRQEEQDPHWGTTSLFLGTMAQFQFHTVPTAKLSALVNGNVPMLQIYLKQDRITMKTHPYHLRSMHNSCFSEPEGQLKWEWKNTETDPKFY